MFRIGDEVISLVTMESEWFPGVKIVKGEEYIVCRVAEIKKRKAIRIDDGSPENFLWPSEYFRKKRGKYDASNEFSKYLADELLESEKDYRELDLPERVLIPDENF